MKRLIQNKKNLYKNLKQNTTGIFKEIFSALEKLEPKLDNYAMDIADYQSDNTTLNIDYNYIKLKLPECIINATCYRGLEISKDKLDKNNLEESIRKQIHKNRELESWTIKKSFVDNMFCSLNPTVRVRHPVLVKLKAKKEGLYLPKFWELVVKNYFDGDSEKVEDKYWISFKYIDQEEEVLAPPSDDYEIYNLDEIRKELN